MPKKPFFTISFIGWMVFVTFASLYSFKRIKPPSIRIPHADKIVHFTFYFVGCVLGVLFLRELTRGIMKFRAAKIAMMVSLISFGAIIELFQHAYVPTRAGDFLDALANSAGAICGLGVIDYWFSKRQKLPWKI